MKISLKATYGIIAALDLALHNGSAPVQAKTIAKRQAIPLRFLEQVLHTMKKAGLVHSLRGAVGGYTLGRKPSEISLADLVEALDGSLTLGTPHGVLTRRLRGHIKPEFLLREVLDQVRQAERRVLGGVTLQDLADRQRQLDQQQTLMYHI
jgi:Rrf2 family protein